MSDINLIIKYDEDGTLEVLAKETEEKLGEAGKKAGKKAGKGFSKSFDKFNKGAGETLTKGLGSALKITTAIGAAVTAIGGVTIFKGISAAIVQEDAVNRLSGALRSSGEFSREAIADFEAYASSLQEVTKIGDEVALNQLSLAKSFGATNEQAKEIVTTAADLAQAFGTDIETQVRLISKTLGGYAGELAETQPKLKALTQEQLRNGEAIDILARQYEGQASNALNTFSGATTQLGNSIGDTLEEIGKLVTQNPAVIKTLRNLNGVFKEAQERVIEFGKTFDIFNDLLIPITEFNNAVIEKIIRPLELAYNIGSTVFNGFNSLIARTISGFSNFGLVIADMLDALGIKPELSEGLKNFEAAAEETADELRALTAESEKNLFNFSVSDRLASLNNEVKSFLVEQKQIIAEEQAALTEETGNKTIEQAQMIKDQYVSVFDVLRETASSALTGVGQDFKDFNKNMEQSNQLVSKFTKQAGQNFQRGFAGAVGGAFAELGKSLASGENAIQAFGQAFLKAIGNTLVQQGTAFILEGTAYTFSANPALAAKGPGLIGAGAAMATFGGILGASGGSGTPATSGGGGGATTNGLAFGGNEGEFVGQIEGESTPQTILNVNVEGNVVDQEAFTRRLVEQVGEEGGKQGLVFNNFQTV